MGLTLETADKIGWGNFFSGDFFLELEGTGPTHRSGSFAQNQLSTQRFLRQEFGGKEKPKGHVSNEKFQGPLVV